MDVDDVDAGGQCLGRGIGEAELGGGLGLDMPVAGLEVGRRIKGFDRRHDQGEFEGDFFTGLELARAAEGGGQHLAASFLERDSALAAIAPGRRRLRMVEVKHRTMIAAAAQFALQAGVGAAQPEAVVRAFPFPQMLFRPRPSEHTGTHQVLGRLGAERQFQAEVFQIQRGRRLERDEISEAAVEFHLALAGQSRGVRRRTGFPLHPRLALFGECRLPRLERQRPGRCFDHQPRRHRQNLVVAGTDRGGEAAVGQGDFAAQAGNAGTFDLQRRVRAD